MALQWLTAKEIGQLVEAHETTIHNRLIYHKMIRRMDHQKGFEITNRGKAMCKYEIRKGKRIVLIEYSQAFDYVAFRIPNKK